MPKANGYSLGTEAMRPNSGDDLLTAAAAVVEKAETSLEVALVVVVAAMVVRRLVQMLCCNGPDDLYGTGCVLSVACGVFFAKRKNVKRSHWTQKSEG